MTKVFIDGSAGAVSVIKRMDDAFLQEVREKVDWVFSSLQGCEGIESVTGKGLMIGIKTKKSARDVVGACMEQGVLCLTSKDKVRLLPPLNIPMELLQRAVQVVKTACK